jgi:hypothetical protein
MPLPIAFSFIVTFLKEAKKTNKPTNKQTSKKFLSKPHHKRERNGTTTN